MSRRSSIILLVFSVLLAYLNSFRGVFQFDDYNVIVYNTVVHSWAAWFSDLSHGIRPFLKLTYTLNWTLDTGLFGFHLFNLIVHTTNVIFFYFISLKFTEHCLKRDTGAPAGKAVFWAAMLFALHPVQTEAVTYISGRSVSLMSFFYMGSILAYCKGSEENKPLWLYFISPLLFLLAVMTKEIAVTLPFSLLLWEKVCRPEKTWRTAMKKQGLHWLLLMLIAIIILAHPGYVRLLESSFATRGLKENLFTQINAVIYLISRLFLINRLNIDPDLSVISFWSLRLSAETALLLSFILTGLLSLKKRPWLGFGILWFLLHLIPTNSLVPRLDVVNERQLYLASCGIFLASAMEGAKLYSVAKNKQKLLGALIITLTMLFCVTLGYFTTLRNQVYSSEIALWEDVRLKSPNKARVYNNLGYAYAVAGRKEDARKAYLTALRLKPDYDLARNNLKVIAP